MVKVGEDLKQGLHDSANETIGIQHKQCPKPLKTKGVQINKNESK